MKKVLIISYFFPPCNYTAANRIMGWANHLHESGYYPIVITRNWDKNIKKLEDAFLSSGKEIINKKHEHFEVFYLPYKANLRDRIYTTSNSFIFRFISKILTLKDTLLENYFNRFIPFKNLYDFSENYLKNNPDISKVIISGNPFIQFKFGYLLKKKRNINWIADYRDNWSTSDFNRKKEGVYKLIANFQKHFEKKWVNTSSFITSVSPQYVKQISEFVKKPGYEVLNGFDIKPSRIKTISDNTSNYTITYNGTLVAEQPIEIFMDSIKKIIDLYKNRISIHINFPGLGFDNNQNERVRKLLMGYEKHYTIFNRLSQSEVIEIQENSNLLLLFAYSNYKGVLPSKLSEYVGLKKLILLTPSDNDIMEKILKETGLGIICNTKEDCIRELIRSIESMLNGEKVVPLNNDVIEKYSKRNQTKILGQLLDKL